MNVRKWVVSLMVIGIIVACAHLITNTPVEFGRIPHSVRPAPVHVHPVGTAKSRR